MAVCDDLWSAPVTEHNDGKRNEIFYQECAGHIEQALSDLPLKLRSNQYGAPYPIQAHELQDTLSALRQPYLELSTSERIALRSALEGNAPPLAPEKIEGMTQEIEHNKQQPEANAYRAVCAAYYPQLYYGRWIHPDEPPGQTSPSEDMPADTMPDEDLPDEDMPDSTMPTATVGPADNSINDLPTPTPTAIPANEQTPLPAPTQNPIPTPTPNN